MRICLTLGATILTVAGLPAPARAQGDLFVQGVRELAATAEAGPASRAAAIAQAAARMRAALGEWDRRLVDLQARATREAAAGPAGGARERYLELGVAYRRRGRLRDALRAFDAAGTGQRPDADLLLLRASTLEAAGEPDGAGATFNAAFAARPTSAVTAYYVMQRMAGGDTRTRALATLTTAYESLDLQGAPAAPPFLALAAVPDTLARTPIVGDEALADAFARLADGRYDEALDALPATGPPVAAGSPVAADPPVAAGRPVAGGSRVAAGLQTRPSDGSPRAHFARGQRDEAEGRIADARRAYRAALPGTLAGRYVLHVGLARLAQVDGDTAAAIDAFRTAVQLAPNEAALHKELAGAYAADERLDDAFAELMAALLIDPRDAQAHAAIGGLFIDSGRGAEAVVALTRALKLAPGRHEARYALARALTQQGRATEAARQLALFEEARRDALERRRRAIASEVEREEAARSGRPSGDAAR